MTSRHNERLQARRLALREQHKQELEEAKRRQAAQLSAVTTFDQRIAKLEAVELEVAESVAEAVEVFGGRKEAADALGLTTAQVRDYTRNWNSGKASSSSSGGHEDGPNEPSDGLGQSDTKENTLQPSSAAVLEEQSDLSHEGAVEHEAPTL
ncbi:hypothetical protein [Streptomyces sp. NPDC018833]|uniref:hypothetical protein n=1 Tax=Streptomyces sp. NPDC018833 TaxID=3365053 RepID=UPI0037BCE0F7